jgi:hypothetical protein
MLQRLDNRSLTEPVPSIPEGFEMTVWLVLGQTLPMEYGAPSFVDEPFLSDWIYGGS